MSYDKKIVLEKIVSYLNIPFKEKEFEFKKPEYYQKKMENGIVCQYTISLLKTKGWFTLSIIPQILNDDLMKKVNSILRMAMQDKRYNFHSAWNEKFIENVIKGRTKNKIIEVLTNWSIFKDKNETLSEFVDRFSIIHSSFDDLDLEYPNWREQLLQSIEYAMIWFKEHGTIESIIKNSKYPALVLLAENSDKIRLESRYKEIHQQSNQHEIQELELFWEYLKKEYKY